MNIIRDKILVLADKETSHIVNRCLDAFSDLEMVVAADENKAFELIYNHTLVLVIQDIDHIRFDPYKTGSMLMSHKQVHNTPLLLLCKTVPGNQFLTDFDDLEVDHLLRPFKPEQIRAKIKIFYDLFKQRSAVHQSIDELDRVYRKIVEQHENAMEETVDLNVISSRSAIAAGQIQNALQHLTGSIYHIMRMNGVPPVAKPKLSAIKTAAEQISMVTKKLVSFPDPFKKAMAGQTYRVLYAQDSDEDFSIFNYFMKGVVNCELTQAVSLEHSLDLISQKRFDIIFIDYGLPDNAAFDLLSRLKRIRNDIPIVFMMDKPMIHKGPETIARGAFTYFAKEELSGFNVLSIINSTLKKSDITREVEDAQNRIVLISRKDYLTKLYNRRCFEQELESELIKVKRYQTDLSVLILDFDRFQNINDTFGPDTGDRILTTSAAIIQSMVRGNDVVCRYGGEEFAVVLPNTPGSGARMLAERIRKTLRDHDFDTDNEDAKLTVSIGISEYDSDQDTDFSDMVKNALSALALAAQKGGDSVEIYKP